MSNLSRINMKPELLLIANYTLKHEALKQANSRQMRASEDFRSKMNHFVDASSNGFFLHAALQGPSAVLVSLLLLLCFGLLQIRWGKTNVAIRTLKTKLSNVCRVATCSRGGHENNI